MPKFKSFDELLEEKLQLENEQPKTPDLEFEFAANPKSGSDSPKPFLRRGSGLARYGGVGGPKNLATSKSRRYTSNVSRKQNNDNAGDKTSTSAPNVGNIETSDDSEDNGIAHHMFSRILNLRI